MDENKAAEILHFLLDHVALQNPEKAKKVAEFKKIVPQPESKTDPGKPDTTEAGQNSEVK